MKLFWVSLATLLYSYVGYPLLLLLVVRLRGPRLIRRGDALPTVTILISAYNEAKVIRQKLDNTLQLDYPRERLEIIVVSDLSSDATDDIVRSYEGRGIRLQRQPDRLGKTAGLNRAVPASHGEVIVFSDANAMYSPDAIRRLVRNFADPDVGCVTGEARYVDGSQTTADVGERAYWNYEVRLKRLETQLGSMVGGDGAIYAIRRSLWQTLPETAINDFLNPLQIVSAGYRAIYEPEAICFEETAGQMGREYRRRVRIVSRSWRAVFQAPGVLNPFRVGLFSFTLFSHKILRWWSAPLLTTVIAFPLWVMVRYLAAAPASTVAIVAAVALLGLTSKPLRRLPGFLWYFWLINVASLVGLIKGSVGRVSGTWSTPRTTPGVVPMSANRIAACGGLVFALLLFAAVSIRAPHATARVVFWASIGMLAYVYIGYPLCLVAYSTVAKRPIRRGAVEPVVGLLIIAYNEAEVMEAKLRNVLALDYPKDRLRISVASDGSTDDTNRIVRTFEAAGVTLIALPERRGKTAAINTAVPRIAPDVEILVFSDANAFLNPDAVRTLTANFEDERVGGVSGDVVLIGDRAALGRAEDLYYKYERGLQRVESTIGSAISVDGALYAIRRHLFVPPPDDTILDDVVIPMGVLTQGYRVVFDSLAIAREQGSRTAREEFSRKSRVIAGAAQLLGRVRRHVPTGNPQILFSFVSHKVLRWLSPLFVSAVLASSLVLASTSRVYLGTAVVLFLFLCAGIAGCVSWLRRFSLIGLAHYVCLVHVAAAVGFVRGMVGRQPAAWRRFSRAPIASGGHV